MLITHANLRYVVFAVRTVNSVEYIDKRHTVRENRKRRVSPYRHSSELFDHLFRAVRTVWLVDVKLDTANV